MDKDDKIYPSTSFLMGNLVDGALDNDLDVNDPIIKYLVKSGETSNNRDDSDEDSALASDDSDIEVLIEEHILLEKLKQVRGKCGENYSGSGNSTEFETDLMENTGISALGTSDASELIHLKTIIEEAMQINLKIREELLVMEKKLVIKYKEECEKKELKLKEQRLAETHLKFQTSGPSDRFLDSFRNPYFKCNGSVAPWNLDSEKILNTNIPFISEFDFWTPGNISLLCVAIRKYLVQEESLHHREAKRNKSQTVAKFVSSSSNSMYLKTAPLYDLMKTRDDDSLDWKQIATNVSRAVTDKDCRQMWVFHVKPSLKVWAPDEHLHMIEIAKKYKLQNWDKVAEQLNTGRTGYECFMHHQNNFVLEWNDGRWTKEEEQHLNNVIENSKIGNYISWDKVTYFMDSKYVEQIYAKWHGFHAPHITRGPFTEREDKILLGMIHKFGADLKTVASVLKNRSVAQLNARYKDHLLPQLSLKIGEWTVEEDEKLLKLVKEFGEANWATIARHFETRSRVQIRHRHKLLKTKLAQNPDLNLKLMHRPKRPTSKKRISKNKLFYSKVISSKGKNVKSLLRGEETKTSKRIKSIDMKLTQYYQMKFLSEKINETEFISRFVERNRNKSDDNHIDLTDDNFGESSTSNLFKNKSLLSSLLFSLIGLRNIYEAEDTDDWSEKDRTAFNKGILELVTGSKQTLDDFSRWHKVFCSLFAAPAVMSHVALSDEWKKLLSNESELNKTKSK